MDAEERIANKAAADFCVPKSQMDAFIARKEPLFSDRDLRGFARILGVHPGIVAGQLQHRTGRYQIFRFILLKYGPVSRRVRWLMAGARVARRRIGRGANRVVQVAERQRLIRAYRDETGETEIDMRKVADFAVLKGWPLPPPSDPMDNLARQFADAARLEIRHDNTTGNPYRANHAVPRRRQKVNCRSHGSILTIQKRNRRVCEHP